MTIYSGADKTSKAVLYSLKMGKKKIMMVKKARNANKEKKRYYN